jgi:hypothetical protein
MMDHSTLREALQPASVPDGYDAAELDVQRIMTRGRRLRVRRRAAAVGGALCVAAAVFGVVTGAASLNGSAPAPPSRLAPAMYPVPSGRPSSVRTATPVPGTPTPLPRASGAPSPSGSGPGASTAAPGQPTSFSSPTSAATTAPQPSRAAGSVLPTATPTR